MQQVIFVKFSNSLPDDDALRATLEKIVGSRIAVASVQHDQGKARLIKMAATEQVVEIIELEQRLLVEIEGLPPDYFEWAVVAALEDLGGTPSRKPPAFSRKKAWEVTWWEKLQFRERFRL